MSASIPFSARKGKLRRESYALSPRTRILWHPRLACSTRGTSNPPSPVLSSDTSKTTICFVSTSTARWILKKPRRLLHLARIHSPLSGTFTPEVSTDMVTGLPGSMWSSRSMLSPLALRQVVEQSCILSRGSRMDRAWVKPSSCLQGSRKRSARAEPPCRAGIRSSWTWPRCRY